VRLSGSLDGERQVLIDNVSEGGRPGWYVLTPLRLANGRAVLVNRGFVPGTGYREQPPEVALPADTPDPVQLTGRVGALPVAGLESGRLPPPAEGPWPRTASFPKVEDIARVLPYELEPDVLLLDADGGPGFVRAWRPPGLDPQRHFGYAVQWWAFAALALVLFTVLTLRRRSA
jgi:cytochrome oxidase assembly protein ShyY1